MSESFTFDVHYSTTFEQIEKLRSLMLGFVQSERRDFQPLFDIVVVGMCQDQDQSLVLYLMSYSRTRRKRHTRPGKDDIEGRYYVQEQLATGRREGYGWPLT